MQKDKKYDKAYKNNSGIIILALALPPNKYGKQKPLHPLFSRSDLKSSASLPSLCHDDGKAVAVAERLTFSAT